MQKAKSVKEFVERIDATKKVNPKDLSSDQDLTIAIMNLISIEEHLVFSGAKTGKNSFYDLIEEVREKRKNLMQKIIPAYEGEVWCISKHLLASSMRLMEVGTKQQSLGNKTQAYDLFNQAYDLYCLFWGLNMNMLNTKDVKWIEDSVKDVKQLSAKVDAEMKVAEVVAEQPTGALAKMKAFVRKAVDCCIE
jgi:predicted CopG family antitoxin